MHLELISKPGSMVCMVHEFRTTTLSFFGCYLQVGFVVLQ
jgi:hypothetical protein